MFKVFTHDLRPPVQGGEPVWNGTLPHTLPSVAVDESDEQCGAGWNFCRELDTALCIAGFWPKGRPSRAFVVTPNGSAIIERHNKCRAATIVLEREVPDEEIESAILRLSADWFHDAAEEMGREHILWRRALARPARDVTAVEDGLRAALAERGLDWQVKRYIGVRDAWTVWTARDVWTAMGAMDVWTAMGARDAWDALDAWGAMDAWSAVGARGARDAWDARGALLYYYAVLSRRISGSAPHLTVGLRDAYYHGLEIALPTERNTLGYAMAEQLPIP